MLRYPFAVLLVSAAAFCASAETVHPIERYEVILDRLPFGAPPPTAGTGAEGGVDLPGSKGTEPGHSADPASGEQLPEPPPVRLQAITRFGNVPAAGFVEIASGRSFLMREGENVNGYTLIEVAPEVGSVVLAKGTNEWCVSISYANGQPTNIVASARAPYLTANALPRKDRAVEPVPEEPSLTDVAEVEPSSNRNSQSAEEAALVEQAMVVGPDGKKRLSYSKLNRLRTEAARKRAEAIRAEAEAKERALREKQQAQEALVKERAELEAAAQKAEKEREEAEARADIVAAIAAGEDVDVEIELTDEEAESLSEAGFEVEE